MTKRFGSSSRLSDVSLTIEPGEIHCILGENGAGKSTLCNLIFGVHAPDTGTMQFDGAPYRPRRLPTRSRAASRWCTSISAWCAI